MRAYKVVYDILRDGSNLVSCSAIGEYEVRYQIGVRTVPIVKGTKLFAFETPEDARAFMSMYNSTYLGAYECEVDGVTDAPSKIPQISTYDFKKFWNGLGVDHPRSTPDGTILCDGITLLGVLEDK